MGVWQISSLVHFRRKDVRSFQSHSSWIYFLCGSKSHYTSLQKLSRLNRDNQTLFFTAKKTLKTLQADPNSAPLVGIGVYIHKEYLMWTCKSLLVECETTVSTGCQLLTILTFCLVEFLENQTLHCCFVLLTIFDFFFYLYIILFTD